MSWIAKHVVELVCEMFFETNPIQQLTGLMARLRYVKYGKAGWGLKRTG